MQRIYYPGFTIAGIAEPVAILLSILLVLVTPRGGAGFWLTLVALLGLFGMHAVYWIVTHPVNRFWLQGEELSGFGSGFFALASTSRRGAETHPEDWTDLRDRWEYSHVARAALAALSFLALLLATSAVTGTLQSTERTEMSIPTTSGFAPVNGLPLYYEIQGSGKPLILLHAGVAASESRRYELAP